MAELMSKIDPFFCSIIITNYNGRALLNDCLSSLAKQTLKNFEVILVDNASKDDSVNFVSSFFPWVKIVRNPTNIGFVEGCNLGAKRAKYNYLVFLNNDTKVDPHWLEELLKVLKSDTSIGICGSTVLSYDGKRVDDAGTIPDLFGFPIYQLGDLHYSGQKTKYVFIATGAAFLIKRELWEKLGGFDSEYFLYGEITDLSWQVQLLGYTIAISRWALVYHRCGTTTGKIAYAQRRYLSERNTLRMLIKNYSQLTLLKVLPRYFGLLLFEFIFFLATNNVRVAITYFKLIAWHIRNFKSTWVQHKKIQQIRVVNDNAIISRMFTKSAKLLFLRYVNTNNLKVPN